MGATYTRQSSFADGDTITAALFNNELDQLVAAFAASTGHSHDGTTAEGGPITVVGPNQDVSIGSTQILPATDDAVSLGSAAKEFKDGYFDGTVYLDGLVIGSSTSITSVDTDLSSVSASDDTLASAKAIKTYIDAQVTAQDLDFQGDSGGALSIDLDSETLTIAGGTGIDTVGSGNTLTVAIDSTVATLTGTQTLTNKTLTTPVISSIVNTGTLTLPTSTDTLVGKATTDTLTNKTISADSNTLSGIAASSFVLSNASGNIDGSAAQKAIPSGVVVGTTDTQTLTNKTINAANNTVSNIAVSMLAGSAVVTEAEGIGSNDNDTTLPTSAAVKDYVDTAVAGFDTLAELLDTTTTSVADNEVLAYDSTSSKWINQTAAEAGLAPATGVNTIVTVGTITTGTWNGTAIGDSYISSASNWNTAYGWGNHASAGYALNSNIGITIQAYDADTAKYDDTTANFTGTLQNGGSNVVVDSDIGVNVQAYNANLVTYATNGNTAYGWGDHASAGYLTGITGQSIKNLSDVYSSMSPSDGQVLTYDTTNGWQAETPAAAGDPAGTAVAMAIALGG